MPSSLPCDAPPCDAVPDERLRLIVDSYRRLTGKELLDEIPDNDEALHHPLWNAPRAIVAHGTEADPVFFYGNRLALELFEMSFEDFTRLPSRFSAEPLERDARARLLERVARQDYVDDYAGVRISGKGKRFMIEAATVWNLIDEAGNHRGQAATFSDWRAL
ncbi:MAG: MEKHLA domain-containing protein [Gallionellales bacterium GWA2_60_142]|nr:MAG: MEKHLA domain-containing protein [Gallionellales bacterium GWA2_60_142]HCI13025.1 MEKHLA domain-containing protein [Gallionellaceae bacterium]